ncbi:uncharacterized protein LTR77_003340 [Saxophila tyrrhenica]|uniref:Uncharacterized protein n=1 Tax=Saxophila tyrrhenica TaxID=1690608 RepID=A0AAV9PGN0_9PEZI|nr:hypothetical protein LTR77_003340 [Saxophila tyrrhenica]
MAFTDLDIAAAPLTDMVVLTGLDYSMRPSNVRMEAEKGWIKPFPEIKVMHQIKSLAVVVYNQEKLASYYHGNVCDGRNALAYFICAMHRQSAPQPQTHTRQGSVVSNSSHSSSNSCKSTGRTKNCELPKLVTTSMLPIGYWDSLYYALVAEIRTLYNDLQQRFGFGCENGTTPLHYLGQDGKTNQPFTAIDFALMLESAWYTLMDNRLVATLDDAVRMRRMRENYAKQEVNGINVLQLNKRYAPDRPPIMYGLMDVNDLSPEIINTLLWDKHAPEVDAACCENFEDESMMTALRAELHQQQMEESLATVTPLPSSMTCTCHATCVCKLKCDESGNGCTCQNRVHLYSKVPLKDNEQISAARYIKEDETIPNRFIGANPTGVAQLQITATAYPSLTANGELNNTIGEPRTESTHPEPRENTFRFPSRARANTVESDLAYVPEARPSQRRTKDTCPLGFYGRQSGQRFPNLRPQSSVSPLDEYGYYGVEQGTGKRIARKPVPMSIAPPPPPPLSAHTPPYSRLDLTPPKSSPYDQLAFSNQAYYPPIPPSQSEGLFDQSFQTTSDTNDLYATTDSSFEQQHQSYQQAFSPFDDRQPVTQSFPQSYNTVTSYNATDYALKQKSISFDQANAADAYTSLLSHHPSTTEGPLEPFPRLSRVITTSPSKKEQDLQQQSQQKGRSTTLTNTLPTLKSFSGSKHIPKKSLDKDLPPMPQPDFIAPRPAVKQRYVSAGGFAKLADRVEIEAPTRESLGAAPVPVTQQRASSGAYWSKEELDEKLARLEWIRQNCGGAALGHPTTSGVATPGRRSDENERSGRGSEERKRKSSGSERKRVSGEKEKKDRTSSGASKRERFKRVFSRKGSGSEGDKGILLEDEQQ